MLRGVWRKLRRLLDQNRVFVPVLAIVVLVLVFVFARLLTTRRLFFPSQQPVITPRVAPRTPAPLEGPAPNVVLIVANSQRADDLRTMPNVMELLAGHGVTFTNAFSTTPLGSPARATILTGQDAFKTGVRDNGPPTGGIYAFKHRSTIATWLRRSGFNTSYIGRYLSGYSQINEEGFVPPGWDDWHAYVRGKRTGYYDYTLDENSDLKAFGPSPDVYITDVLADRAASFIEGAREPFFVHLSSFALQPPAQPEPEDAGAFRNEPPFRPKSFNVQASGDSPAAEQPVLDDTIVRYMDGYRRNSLGALRSLDRAVARVVKAVEDRGDLDNTVFIYTSDKGLLLGEHRLFNVTWPYEPAVRIPLVVRVPWLTEGVTDDRLVTNADITPTIAELTGVRTQITQDGMSFAPLLHREEIPWREEVRLSYLGGKFLPSFPPRYRAIRTDRYKLVVYEDRSRELFDLQRDPDELNNLAGTEAASKIEGPLFERLEELMPKFPRIILPLPTYPPSPGPEPQESQD